MNLTELNRVASAMVAKGKGILAADESSGTIKKRFDTIGLESTEESRRAYRNLLFTTPGAEEFISGVILYDETIRQSAEDGTPFPELLEHLRARKNLIDRPVRRSAHVHVFDEAHFGFSLAAIFD